MSTKLIIQRVRSSHHYFGKMVERIALNPVLGYFIIGGLLGVVLVLIHLSRDGHRAYDPKTLALAAALPALGWGPLEHAGRSRSHGANVPPKNILRLNRMGLANAIILTGQLLLFLMLLTTWGHQAKVDISPDPSMTNATGAVLVTGTNLAINAFLGMGLLLAAFMALAVYVFFFFVLCAVPWIMAGSARREHLRARVRELEQRTGSPR
jgi:hypothetical protein